MNWKIYKHTTPNEKVYIGVTSRPVKERWNSGHGYKRCVAFWNAIQKYGWNNIKHEVLYEVSTQEEAEILEMELIEYYQSTNPDFGYNIEKGGFIHKVGIKPWNTGLPKEQQPAYGHSPSQETRERIAKKLSKPVYCVELDKVFDSAQQASKELGIQFSNISRCLHGRGHTAGGYHWGWA